MTSAGVPSPGWFPDPGNPAGERWWSGEAWTDYTRLPEAAPAPVPAPAPTPVLAPAAPADAPPQLVPAAASGLPSTADPEIANHYRQALSTPAPVHGDAALTPSPTGSPTQPGWAGMPLPGAGHGGYATAGHGYDPSGGYHAPADTRAGSSYAAARTAANATIPSGSNKAATVALSAGLSSLAALALILFGRILIVPSLLSLVAIIMGIIGLALAKRAGTGVWQALGGLLMGLATAGAVGASIVLAVFEATTLDTDELERQIVDDSVDYYGVDVVTANCPSNVSLLGASEFSCTAIDSSGVAYLVDVEVTREGFVWWELRL